VSKVKAAVIGSGNIGTDLMIKILRLSSSLEVAAMVGIDPSSDGLARAARLHVPVISDGVEGLVKHPSFGDISIVFDATSAAAHLANANVLNTTQVRMIDLTPAARGPFVVPPVNLTDHLDAQDLNMVTCGGQATIPIVAAVSSVTPVHYAEIIASISSRSAGPGTRANIDEFTETTSRAIEAVGGARRGKAIIVLNPAEPPLIMRDTVHCLVTDGNRGAIVNAVERMVSEVNVYVPGYRLKQRVQMRDLAPDAPESALGDTLDGDARLLLVSVFLEVEGAGHYLPPYAGNLDIMTSAALRVGEQLALQAVKK
jgi:acetaldehyde dehydrogenase